MIYYEINMYPCKERPDEVIEKYSAPELYPSESYLHSSRYKKVKCVLTDNKVHLNKFVPQSSSHSRSRKCHETCDRINLNKDGNDLYIQVSNSKENRLDVIASRYYGNSSLWWVIAAANASILFDPMNVPTGSTLRIPPISSVL